MDFEVERNRKNGSIKVISSLFVRLRIHWACLTSDMYTKLGFFDGGEEERGKKVE